ncbi:PP2C family protein-serine/threonine phosphatase [Planctomycetota bacterium]
MNCMEVWGGNRTSENHIARPGLDIWTWSRSVGVDETAGNDLHLLSSCASGRITRMLLAEVCGDGTAFREIAEDLRELMKRNVNSVQQERFVGEMSRRLVGASQRGGFATTLISTYFAPTRSFNLCNAGHPPPLLFRAPSQEWSVLKQAPADLSPAKAPLGVVDLGEYQQFKTKLDVGDMVLSFSNVLTECRNTNGRVLGLEGVLNRVQQLGSQEPSNLVTDLVTLIQSEHTDNLATDDATAILCRATETKVAWRDNVLALFRLLRAVSDKTRIE